MSDVSENLSWEVVSSGPAGDRWVIVARHQGTGVFLHLPGADQEQAEALLARAQAELRGME